MAEPGRSVSCFHGAIFECVYVLERGGRAQTINKIILHNYKCYTENKTQSDARVMGAGVVEGADMRLSGKEGLSVAGNTGAETSMTRWVWS